MNTNIQRNPISSLPLYDTQIPTNYSVKEEEQQPTYNHIPNTIRIYSDASCKPNPGKGAAAMYIPPTPQISETIKTKQYPRPITITTGEIGGLQLITNTISTLNITAPLQFEIYTDSKTALQYLNFTSLPKYENTKQEITKIFRDLHTIQQQHPDYHVAFNKIKAHDEHKYNNKVDEIAKAAVETGQYDKDTFNEITY